MITKTLVDQRSNCLTIQLETQQMKLQSNRFLLFVYLATLCRFLGYIVFIGSMTVNNEVGRCMK
jgi:hypothetical protein